MCHNKLPGLFVLPLLACCSLNTHSLEQVSIPPDADDNFSAASFHLRVPEKVKKPCYILVLLPGYNGEGDSLLEHTQWVAFAEKTDAAIVSCTFKSMDKSKENYVHYAAAQHGSGAALESALVQLDAKDSLHSLKDLPLLIYGHSAGGQFAYGFSCHNPKRMIGFAAAKGGFYFPEPTAATFTVPGLIISGEKDLARRRKAIRSLFENHRTNGAPWCWMEDAAGHEEAECLSVVIPYFTDLVRLRLKKGDTKLLDIPKQAGITIDLLNKKILHEGTTNESNRINLQSGFLPSKSVFQAWKQLDTGKRKYAEQEAEANGGD